MKDFFSLLVSLLFFCSVFLLFHSSVFSSIAPYLFSVNLPFSFFTSLSPSTSILPFYSPDPSLLLLLLPQGYLLSHTGSPHSSLSLHIFISMSKCHPFIFLQMNRLGLWKRTKENMSRTQFLLVREFSCTKQWWDYINSPLYNQKN